MSEGMLDVLFPEHEVVSLLIFVPPLEPPGSLTMGSSTDHELFYVNFPVSGWLRRSYDRSPKPVLVV